MRPRQQLWLCWRHPSVRTVLASLPCPLPLCLHVCGVPHAVRALRRIVKLVRAIRKGWLKTSEQQQKAQEPPVYLLWGDDGQVADQGTTKTAVGLSYIPPAKPKLPGHAESYHPPAEYLPTEVRLAACV